MIGGGRGHCRHPPSTDGWYDRCEPFFWTKPADEILAKAIRKETLLT
jgi:hypothetical protein